ncbi:MAG: protocatechuate 3,4-dioxygenase subunit beta [Pseudomonadota bacterium]|nr:protocatechuate 3,4-dioxygenase subunit beta [Pseudomonadota bacterium]
MKFDEVAAGQYPLPVYEPYKSTRFRGPLQAPLRVDAPTATTNAIQFSPALVTPIDADLTAHGSAAPLGEKIVVTGRVTDEDGQPVRDSLIEVWQCNSAGRYFHSRDQHDAPLDPNFFGFGKFLTRHDGRYRFVTIKPAAYPWGNHPNAWRPAHIHFSLFGNVYAQRLVTQMYFPGDPLHALDPIFNSVPDANARQALVARFSIEESVGDVMLGYVFDIVLRGRDATPFDH